MLIYGLNFKLQVKFMNDTDLKPAKDGALSSSFLSLGLRSPLSDNLSSLGYETMTPIQAQSIPPMLLGKDIIAQAKTGSGKTAAFGLATLNHLNIQHYAIQALILCPTRELAEQVTKALRTLARLLPNVKVLNLSGGIPMKPQLDSLRHGAHIIVGTPGRIQKHLDKQSLSFDKLQLLILDEADRMLDMGFFEPIKQIIQQCPQKRQTCLFSATYPSGIKQLAAEFLKDPIKIVVEEPHTKIDIEQHFYEVSSSSQKNALLKAILCHYKSPSALIFCNTKEQTTQLAHYLNNEGFSALALNGDMEQIDRDMTMIRFINQSSAFLIATDVAARGLDIKELPLVINFDLAFDLDVHIHRIGRTGRAGSKGLAISITTPADATRLTLIEDEVKNPICWKSQASLNLTARPQRPQMVTLALNAGRKDKIRPGDILGALTKDAALPADCIGKIDITALYSYVAIHENHVHKAYEYLQTGKLKGRKISARKLKAS